MKISALQDISLLNTTKTQKSFPKTLQASSVLIVIAMWDKAKSLLTEATVFHRELPQEAKSKDS